MKILSKDRPDLDRETSRDSADCGRPVQREPGVENKQRSTLGSDGERESSVKPRNQSNDEPDAFLYRY